MMRHLLGLIASLEQTELFSSKPLIARSETDRYTIASTVFPTPAGARFRRLNLSLRRWKAASHRPVHTAVRGKKVVPLMAVKTANVTARVQPEIKQKAEAILEQLGIPVSVLIDSLYRQIIMTNSIPYSFRVPAIPTQDGLSAEQFNQMMETGLNQATSRLSGFHRTLADVLLYFSGYCGIGIKTALGMGGISHLFCSR